MKHIAELLTCVIFELLFLLDARHSLFVRRTELRGNTCGFEGIAVKAKTSWWGLVLGGEQPLATGNVV